MPAARLQSLVLTLAALAVAAICVFGGVRLALQGAWPWGLGLGAAGLWTGIKAVLAYRSTVAPPRRGGPARRGRDRG